MRFRHLTLLLLVFTASCDRKHPAQLLGTWVKDTLYGAGILHATDTLRLRQDGIVLRSGGFASTALSTQPLKPTVYAEGLKWAYRPFVEGPLLCFIVDAGQEADCHTVRIASESVIVVDGNSYRRLPD